MNSSTFNNYDFSSKTEAGLLVCTGGFEDRAIVFPKKLRKSRCTIEKTLVLKYLSQKSDNNPNYQIIKKRLQEVTGNMSESAEVHSDKPIKSYGQIKAKIQEISSGVQNRKALVDISGMRQIWALGTIHACLSCGLSTSVVYTEARWYFPLKRNKDKLVEAWANKNYEITAQYLQSEALKAVHILPEFSGNLRPGRPTCLMIFPGYEPNRVEGLVDDYAPGALIVFYGSSPHKELRWRTDLSKDLHKDLFSGWFHRETEISTLEVNKILEKLEEEFRVVGEEYDVAIAPLCSKMQTLASYLFWRRHPEVQIIFTSPVRFKTDRYSQGTRETFIYKIS